MTEQIQFRPVESFQRARLNALAIQGQEDARAQAKAAAPARARMNQLAMQKAELGLSSAESAEGRAGTEFDQAQSLKRVKGMHNTMVALQGIDASQRDAAVQSIAPHLETLGVDVSAFAGENISDAGLAQGVAAMQGLIDKPDAMKVAFQKGATALVKTKEGPAFATSSFDPATGKTTTSTAQIEGELISRLGETGQDETIRKIDEAKGRADAKGISERGQTIITNGLAAADSTAPIRRAIQLIEGIETGGIDRVAQAAKRFFGIESADEGELSNLMGKAVLSQLKDTFGAAFTKGEKDSLDALEASFTKSPVANKRLLKNALKIAERSAERGIRRAVEAKDFETAKDIQESLDFILGDIEPEQATPPAPVQSDAQPASGIKFLGFEE